MVVSTVGGGDVGGRLGGGGDVRPPPLKHYSQIYCDSSDIGSVSGGGAVTRSAGVQEMVVAGCIGLGESAGGSKGGGGIGADRSVGIWRRYEVLRWRD